VAQRPARRSDPHLARELSIVRGLVIGGLGVLGFIGLGLAVATPVGVLGWLIVAVIAMVGAALLVERHLEQRVASRESAADASVRRLLQGLGRSTSAATIEATMVDALRGASGADHVVVARRHPGDRDIEAVLMTASERAPLATTRLPGDLLTPGLDADDAIAGLVARVRADFGLRNVIARPLEASSGPLGALLLSRRTDGPWSDAQNDLLETAATELSLALDRAAARQAAETGARIDALTGLPNRRHFDELAELLTRGRRAGDALGVLMIDIDHFKRINDTYGHGVGDTVLSSVAAAIAAGVRAADTPARFGGEEFAVLLRRATLEQACDVALRIREAVGSLDTRDLGVTDGRPISVSVGVAVGGSSGETVAALIRRADDALYAAKRRGRDRVVVDELAA
jgi:diguanylate cyclase (GGDEF)-like protein